MVFDIKKLFKKVCMVSAAATMAVGLGSSFVGATAPTNGTTTGTKLNNSVTISASETALTASIELASNLKYNGSAQSLVTSATIIPPSTITDDNEIATAQAAINASGATLYLRVVKQGATDDKKGWAEVWKNGSAVADALNASNLKGTEAGKYDIYYYIDGNGNYNDSSNANS